MVREFCGHGIGRKFHEEPQVLHYGKAGTGLRLEPGMTFTIEPMINAGKPGIRELADGWTIVTKDHSLSAQWEHTVLVTETRLRSADGFGGHAAAPGGHRPPEAGVNASAPPLRRPSKRCATACGNPAKRCARPTSRAESRAGCCVSMRA